MKTKMLVSGLWAIVSLIAMLFEPVCLADFGVVFYFAYYLFFAINAGTAANVVGEQITEYLSLNKKR
jgi:hypothetical protein